MGAFRVRGHPAALAFVERSVASGRPPHALLLAGPEGVGKTTLALDLAAGLLCLDPEPSARPCWTCAACRKLDHGNHPDLHRLAPEGAGQQIRLGQVQTLAAELALLPLEGRFRVAVIEHAQRLNPDAQNALLKTLEEPPAATVLALAADDSSALLPTVISRCVRLRLGPVPADVVAGMLVEAGRADAPRGAAIAQLAAGRPGVAFALAAQPDAVIAQSRLARSLIDLLAADRRRRLSAQAGLLEDGARLALSGAGSSPETAERSARRPSPAERRAAVAQVLTVWRAVARDLALAARGARRELRQRELIDDLILAAETVDPGEVGRFLSRLEAVSRAVDAYANPELALDALLLAWPSPRRAA